MKSRIISRVLAIFILVIAVEASIGLYISAHLCDLNTGAEIDVYWEVFADGKNVHRSKIYTLKDSVTHAYEQEVPITVCVQVNKAKKAEVRYTYIHRGFTKKSSFGPLQQRYEKLIYGYTRINSFNPDKHQPIVINELVYKYYLAYVYTITVDIEKSNSDNLFKFDKALQLDFYKPNNNSKVKQDDHEKDMKYSYKKGHKGNFIIEKYL